MAKTKVKPLITPLGVAVYPHVHAADTKFDKAGVYSTKVRFTGDAADTMRARLDAAAEAAVEAAVATLMEEGKAKTREAARKKVKSVAPYTEELDDEGEETGAILVNFKKKASGVRVNGEPWTAPAPALFDAAMQPVPAGLKLGGGSHIRVSYTPNEFYTAALGAGSSCRLVAIQIVELKTWGGVTAEYAGFDAIEGGFSADDVEAVDSFVSSQASSEEDDEGDDDDDF